MWWIHIKSVAVHIKFAFIQELTLISIMVNHNIFAFIHIWNVEIHIVPQYIHIAPLFKIWRCGVSTLHPLFTCGGPNYIHFSSSMDTSFNIWYLNLNILLHWTEVICGHLHIFAPVQKANIALTNFIFMKKFKAFSRLWKLFNYKTTGRSCTDEVRVKVPSFQKVTLYTVI